MPFEAWLLAVESLTRERRGGAQRIRDLEQGVLRRAWIAGRSPAEFYEDVLGSIANNIDDIPVLGEDD